MVDRHDRDFGAPPEDFLLAADALRIKNAAMHDPLAAVNASTVEPLPHQIRAVYEEFLPRVPLRYLLADDPGAGKTIMAGLYVKEMILRSACERAIIVVPGSLVEQWRDELAQKFDLDFEIFDRSMVDFVAADPFAAHPYLVVRMDQLARSDDLMEALKRARWDIAIVDEAHRMSAHYSSWTGQPDETRRFALGRVLGDTSTNFLLMTATPHSGNEEDFQLFMSLLDRDRFEGRYRPGVHTTDTAGLMRRMVKEDLLTFEGKPLFPKRRAFTVEYELSAEEMNLYEEVTQYVRHEMNRAERFAGGAQERRRANVGFALLVLQRRLASSPEAILRSLERRRDKLAGYLSVLRQSVRHASPAERRLIDADLLQAGDLAPVHAFAGAGLPGLDDLAFDDVFDEVPNEWRAEAEARLDDVIDGATAATTMDELGKEIATLDRLVALAREVRASATDRKWQELGSIIDTEVLGKSDDGLPRKLIVFTEHRDTLRYLEERITTRLGSQDAVVTIHGGTSRAERLAARDAFVKDPGVVVLLATDAAGEGMNLHRAHLMVNYDLPWNPNRIEQRFGRIHRIGQKNMCYLWNLVAKGTREGDVFRKLLKKIERMGKAYNGNLFHVLGGEEAFANRSLHDLLVEAIRGEVDDGWLDSVIGAGVSDGLVCVARELALDRSVTEALDVEEIRERMWRAAARKLQPGYIEAFFIPAFERLGGVVRAREAGRFEVAHVPGGLRDPGDVRLPRAFERVTFDPALIDGRTRADLLAPGHPLLDAVVEATLEILGPSLRRGTVLIDRRAMSAGVSALVAVEQTVEDSAGRVAGRYFDHVRLVAGEEPVVTDLAPFADFDVPQRSEATGVRELATEWKDDDFAQALAAAGVRREPQVEGFRAEARAYADRVIRQVRDRLSREINFWYGEHMRLAEEEREGKRHRLTAKAALARAEKLEERREMRLAELSSAGDFQVVSSDVKAVALVVPEELLSGARDPMSFQREADARKRVERRGVEAVLRAERALGRTPTEQAFNNPGFDVLSVAPDGRQLFIEVKARVADAKDFIITHNEVVFGRTHGSSYVLALVKVSERGPAFDEVRYIENAFGNLPVAYTSLDGRFRNHTLAMEPYWEDGYAPL